MDIHAFLATDCTDTCNQCWHYAVQARTVSKVHALGACCAFLLVARPLLQPAAAAVPSAAASPTAAAAPAALSPRQRKLAAKRQQKQKQASPGLTAAPKHAPAAKPAIKPALEAVKPSSAAAQQQGPVNSSTVRTSRKSVLPAGTTSRLQPQGWASGYDTDSSTTPKEVQQSTRSRQSSPPRETLQQAAHAPNDFFAWSIFNSASTDCSVAAMSNTQLVQLVQHWAAEVAASLNQYAAQQLQAVAHNPTEGMESQTTPGTTRAASAAEQVALCVQAPFKWWSQLTPQQQTLACQNVLTAAEEALARLDSTQRESCTVSCSGHGEGLDATCDVNSLHPLLVSRLQPMHDMHAAAGVAIVEGISNRLTAAAHPTHPHQLARSSHASTSGSMEPLTQQELADIVWGLAHLACACSPPINTALQLLQRALGVPFVMLPVCLPGLDIAWFREEVQLRQDTIYLDGGTRAVQEARLTGWQSEGGHTFKYSGKEMQPEAGGLSPAVAQVRDELKRMIGVTYDSVLVNYYPDGHAGMRYHVDPLYGCWTPESCVVSIGRPRSFVFREITDHASRWSYTVRTGDACIMFGDCQDWLQHAILTEKGNADADAGRISLVFKQRIVGR